MIPALRDAEAIPLLAELIGLLLMGLNALVWPLLLWAVLEVLF